MAMMQSCRYCIHCYAKRETFYRFPILQCKKKDITLFVSPDAARMTQEDVACEMHAKECEYWERKPKEQKE